MKNLLTDKTLKAFERYLIDNYKEEMERISPFKSIYDSEVIGIFEKLPDSMQYGVIVDFFDSVGIVLNINQNGIKGNWYYTINGKVGLRVSTPETRPEARKAAVEKANHLFNQIN